MLLKHFPRCLDTYLHSQAGRRQPASGNEGLRVRVGRGGWLEMERVPVLLEGGGGQRRRHLGLREGCFSPRGRRQPGDRPQRPVGLWGRRMEGWSDSFRSDGCGVEDRRVPSRLAPGSSLSAAEGVECTCRPCKTRILRHTRWRRREHRKYFTFRPDRCIETR